MGEKQKQLGTLKQSISKKRKLLVLSGLTLTVILLGAFNTLPHQQTTHAASAVGGDWTMYMNGDKHQGFNSAETLITPASAPKLKVHWSDSAGGAIFSQAVVANGMVYWGSVDGYEHASDLQGNRIWQQYLGAKTGCTPLPTLGVISTATVASVSINGAQTPVAFVGGGDDYLYALNASTGAVIWRTAIGDPATNTFLWDSPLVYNNSVFIGSATDGEPKCPLIPAQLVQLDVATGQIQHTFKVVPDGCLGGGIWTSPTLDTSDNSIYITTGTQGSFHRCKEPYAIAIVKLRASDLSYIDSWQIPPALRGDDSDFGATPTLFNATIGGVARKMVGAINKNGIYYAFDRTALHNGPVWAVQLAEAGDCPQCGKGSISSSAWNGTALFVATTKTTVKGKTCAGSQRSLNPKTGATIWERCLVDGAVLGAVSMVPGVVAVVAGPDLVLLSSVTGKTLFNSKGIGITGLYGSASVAHGVLYVGSTTKKLYAFGT